MMTPKYGNSSQLGILVGKNVSSIELLEDAGCLTLDFEDGSSLVLETFLKKGVRVALKKNGKPVAELENT